MDHRTKCKCETIRFLEDNRGGNLDELGYDNDFYI